MKYNDYYKGIFPCFFGGFDFLLFCVISRARSVTFIILSTLAQLSVPPKTGMKVYRKE